MIPMTSIEFVQDVTAVLQAGMAEDLAAGHHLVGDAAKAQGDFDTRVPWVLALAAPAHGQDIEMPVTADQIVGNAQDGSPELTIGAADQRAVGSIHLIALITGPP